MSLWANIKFFPEPTGELYGWLLVTLVIELALSSTLIFRKAEESIGSGLGVGID